MKTIIGLLIAGIIFIAGCTTGQQNPQACTAEAKLCPDGTAVGRNPSNNCEFDPCPVNDDFSYLCGERTICPTVGNCIKSDPCKDNEIVKKCGSMIICPDGEGYDKFSIVDEKCFEINYLRDPCGELPGGRVMQITPEICQQAGGNWNECGNVCTGYGPDCIGIAVCNPQCECGGIAGFNCPAGYECRLSGKIVDEIGVCIPKANV